MKIISLKTMVIKVLRSLWKDYLCEKDKQLADFSNLKPGEDSDPDKELMVYEPPNATEFFVKYLKFKDD